MCVTVKEKKRRVVFFDKVWGCMRFHVISIKKIVDYISQAEWIKEKEDAESQ